MSCGNVIFHLIFQIYRKWLNVDIEYYAGNILRIRSKIQRCNNI